MNRTPTAKDIIRPDIQALSAYHVPDARGFVKLDAMENPHRLPEHLKLELAARLAEAALNLYPDPHAEDVKTGLRRAFKLPESQSIILGNGSDELIQTVLQAINSDDAVVMGLEPSFVMYKMISQFNRLRYVGVPLTANFELDIRATLAAIETHQPKLIFLAYPNNPTGGLFNRADIEAILLAAPGLVVVDEAYQPFAGGATLADALPHYPNLVVMRTVSKLGLAGLRLGYLIGDAAWINEFDKLRLPYNINVLSQAAAVFMFEHVSVLLAQADQIVAERTPLAAGLAALPSVEVFKSEANFILIRTPHAEAAFAYLLENRILIKALFNGNPLLKHCLRITVGTSSENTLVLATLTDFFARVASTQKA